MMMLINIILDLLKFVIEGLFEGFTAIIELVFEEKVTIEYEATLTKPSEVFKRKNTGSIIGGKPNQRISKELSRRGILISGGSGSGKTVSVILGNLLSDLDEKVSYIIHDLSEELAIKSSGYHSSNRPVYILNWMDCKNVAFNPFKRCTDRTSCEKICTLLVRKVLGNSSQNSYWDSQAIMLLTCLLQLLLQYPEQQYKTPANLKRLVDAFAGGNVKAIEWLFVKFADEQLFSEFKSILATEPRVLSNIISTARTATSMFGDPKVARITSYDTLNFTEAFRTGTASTLYLQCKIADLDHFAILTSIFLSQFWEELMTDLPNPDTDNDVSFILDEFSALASVLKSEIFLYLANCRKYQISNILSVQGVEQLVHALGSKYQMENVRSNTACKIYLPSGGMSIEQATEISRLLGKRTLENEEGHKVVREIMTPQEVYTSSGIGFCFIDNMPCMLLKMSRYYKQRKLLARSNIPPVAIETTIPTEIPLIPFEQPPKSA